MSYLIGILVIAVGIAISVALHEVGHLVPAKLLGVKVLQYMVGFGPTAWSRKKGETEYGFKWIPLGGYIRMIGMYPPLTAAERELDINQVKGLQRISLEARKAEAEGYDEAEVGRSFINLPVYKRLIIMLGGPCMNLLLSILFTAIMLVGIGVPQLTSTISQVAPCLPELSKTEAKTVNENCATLPPSPAQSAGLKAGDKITAVDGKQISDFAQLSGQVAPLAGKTATLQIERDGQTLQKQVQVAAAERYVIGADGKVITNADGSPKLETRGVLGVTGTREMVSQPISSVPELTWQAAKQTAGLVVALPVRMVQVAEAAFTDKPRDVNGPIGIVGVSRIAGEVTASEAPGFGLQQKAWLLVSIMASLNMALFIFNLVPLPPLDGGHVAGALIEAIRRPIYRVLGKPDPGHIDMAKALPLTYGVFFALLAMTVVLVYADIVRPVSILGG